MSGRVYLLLAVMIFAAANSITRRLTDLGGQHLIAGRNPISLCNVLFVGNLCALLLLIAVYRQQLQIHLWQRLSRQTWLNLIVVAVLGGALGPALIFTALSTTTVNNVVLIGRIEPALVLALSVFLLKEQVNFWVIAGAVLSFVGVGLTIALQPPLPVMAQASQGMNGELLTVLGAIVLAIATVISKISLYRVPLGIFSIVRTALGTVVFFCMALVLYGWHHFADAFAPVLWQWMVLYSAVIVVGGQLLWFSGLRQTTASEVSLANSFSPIAGLLAAYLILGEAPTVAQYLGGSVILLDIALNQIGVIKLNATAHPLAENSCPQAADLEVGFKGI